MIGRIVLRAAKQEGVHGLARLLLSDGEAGGKKESQSRAENVWCEGGPLETGNGTCRLHRKVFIDTGPSNKKANNKDAEGDFEFVDKGDGSRDEALPAFAVDKFIEVADIGDDGIAKNDSDGDQGSRDTGGNKL